MPEYILAGKEHEYEAAAGVFREYAQWLAVDLSFQHFEEELQQLKKMYATPEGGIILCREGNVFIACVAIRKINKETAELKRMFVREGHRRKGIGEQLMQRSISLAVQCGYKAIRLDTLKHMTSAIGLYKKYGFREIGAYYHNPIESAVYFELGITGQAFLG